MNRLSWRFRGLVRVTVLGLKLGCCLLVGCTDTVGISIEDPELRERYIDILSRTDLAYHVEKSGKIIVHVKDIETLDAKMGEYAKFRAKRVDRLNEQLWFGGGGYRK